MMISGVTSLAPRASATILNCLAILFATVLLVTGAVIETSAEEKPWDERVIREHVSISDYAGRLSSERLNQMVTMGEKLFTGKFTTGDGFGRPQATQAIIPTKQRQATRSAFQRLPGPDANSCASCHNDPVIGGAGHSTANVFVSEGFTNANFDSTDPQFSNERNTNHLMGIGLVELLAREMTRDLMALRADGLRQARNRGKPVTVNLVTKGVGFGELTANPDGTVDLEKVEGVDGDLNIRPFSHKGVFSSIRQFTVNAMNHHHGMQAVERFGARWTGETDFDGDEVESELTKGDIAALVAWQASLAPPGRLVPENAEWANLAKRGERGFSEIGCAECHRPALPLDSTLFSDPGNFDVAGTLRATETDGVTEYDLAAFEWFNALPRNDKGQVMVPLFSDLKRHRISDAKTQTFGNELLAQRFVERDQFQTTELWGVASTAPYGHRGDLLTLDEAIRAHGGDAADAAENYRKLGEADRQSVIAFLKTLVIADD